VPDAATADGGIGWCKGEAMELVVREHPEKDEVANDRDVPLCETRDVEFDKGCAGRLISAPDGALIPWVVRGSPKRIGTRILALVARLIILLMGVAAGVIGGGIGALRHECETGRINPR
jgi:hypothetical protein